MSSQLQRTRIAVAPPSPGSRCLRNLPSSTDAQQGDRSRRIKPPPTPGSATHKRSCATMGDHADADPTDARACGALGSAGAPAALARRTGRLARPLARVGDVAGAPDPGAGDPGRLLVLGGLALVAPLRRGWRLVSGAVGPLLRRVLALDIFHCPPAAAGGGSWGSTPAARAFVSCSSGAGLTKGRRRTHRRERESNRSRPPRSASLDPRRRTSRRRLPCAFRAGSSRGRLAPHRGQGCGPRSGCCASRRSRPSRALDSHPRGEPILARGVGDRERAFGILRLSNASVDVVDAKTNQFVKTIKAGSRESSSSPIPTGRVKWRSELGHGLRGSVGDIKPLLPIRFTQHGPICCGGPRREERPTPHPDFPRKTRWSLRIEQDRCLLGGSLSREPVIMRTRGYSCQPSVRTVLPGHTYNGLRVLS
jgi:hypothetical protein